MAMVPPIRVLGSLMSYLLGLGIWRDFLRASVRYEPKRMLSLLMPNEGELLFFSLRNKLCDS